MPPTKIKDDVLSPLSLPRAKALTLTILKALYLKDDTQKPHPLLSEAIWDMIAFLVDELKSTPVVIIVVIVVARVVMTVTATAMVSMIARESKTSLIDGVRGTPLMHSGRACVLAANHVSNGSSRSGD